MFISNAKHRLRKPSQKLTSSTGNDLHDLRGECVPLGRHILEFTLDTRDMFPQLEHTFRWRECRTNDRHRRELCPSRRSFLCHLQQFINMEVIWTLYIKSNLLQLWTQEDCRGVFLGIKREDESEVLAVNEREGVEVLHGTKGWVDTALRDRLSGRWPNVVPLNREPSAPREVKLAEGPYKWTRPGFGLELAAWSAKLQEPSFWAKAEVDCGDVGEVEEAIGGSGKVGLDWGHIAFEGKFQSQ